MLGYTPDEIVNHSTWEFFPEEELPYARKIHRRGIAMDKAAVLSYCRVRNRLGEWVCCECCFTVVYDVMIVCTSVYRRGLESQSKTCHHVRAVNVGLTILQSEPSMPRSLDGCFLLRPKIRDTTCCRTFRTSSISLPWLPRTSQGPPSFLTALPEP